jgi:hypothetical protein
MNIKLRAERDFNPKRQPINTLIISILCGPILLRVFVLVWKYLYLGNKTELFLFLLNYGACRLYIKHQINWHHKWPSLLQ